ncbi:rhodanese-like domain-containing protein [Leisingera sp. F5]|uniref:rhodanese-like domain-containing protein n=1 Tax=Leisingera sp. F5 TaxID=1813816 RepID=UPI000AEE1437|nr:rhodanese-like domain-containing protein [Leisingera sp. F5]
MAQNFTKGLKSLIDEANSEVAVMTIDDAKVKVSDENYVFVDIRDGTEVQRTGLLPGAVHCSRGTMEFQIAPDSPHHKPVFNQDKTYVFYCAAAGRSALAAKLAMDMGMSPVMHMAGGFDEWVKQGGPVDTSQN